MTDIYNHINIINSTCVDLNIMRQKIKHDTVITQNNKKEDGLLYEKKIYTIAWFYKNELETLIKLNKFNIVNILVERFSDIDFENIENYDHKNEESTKTIFPKIKKHINLLKDINRYINLTNTLNKLVTENTDQSNIDFHKYIINNYIEYFKFLDTKIEFN